MFDALHAFNAFNACGLQALQKGSSRAKCTRVVFSREQGERLWALLHHSPRDFGKPTSVWTLDAPA